MLEWLEAHQLPCLFKAACGLECPGCGFQRALVCLLKGQIGASLCAWPALLPFLLFLLMILAKIMRVEKISGKLLKNTGFVCLIIILISYLLKLIIHTFYT